MISWFLAQPLWFVLVVWVATLFAAESGALDMELINRACTRVLSWKMQLGLL